MFGLLWISLRSLLFSLVVFTLIRLGFYLSYPEYFGLMSSRQLPGVFLLGLRFDMSITVVFAALFLLPLLIPLEFFQRKNVVKICLSGVFVSLLLAWTVSLGDIVYFGEVFRHAGRELLLLSEDYGILFELAIESHRKLVFFAVLGTVLLAVLWKSLVINPALTYVSTGGVFPRFLVALLTLVVLVIAGRGAMIDGKPISLVDAFATGDERGAALALNGAFAVTHNIRRSWKKIQAPLAYFSPEELVKKQKKYGWSQSDPFVRSWYDGRENKKNRNVILILLESWSSQYVDGLAGTNYGATPFIDSLLDNSRVWTNAYAASQRSIEGVQAVLTSVPLLESQLVLGWGLEQNRMARLGSLLGERGYQTVMVQASNRRSFHMDGIATTLGFSDYFGKEDFPLRRSYPGEEPRFGWDYETLMFLADYLERRSDQGKPFFSFLFTGTTHEPFPDPGKEFHLYEHASGTIEAYLNTLRYSDWSIEQFMHRAAKQPWYDDTVFVFISDHVLRASAESLHDSFRIPLIVYSPDQSIKPGRDDSYASQYDILPTLMTLLDIDHPVPTFGRSLLMDNPVDSAGVLVKRGTVTGWLAAQGWFTFTGSALLEAGGAYENIELRGAVEKRLKARLQLADQRLLRNEWQPESFTVQLH